MNKETDDAWLNLRTLRQLVRTTENDLRERVKEISPEITHDVNVMGDLIREIIKTERDKTPHKAINETLFETSRNHKARLFENNKYHAVLEGKKLTVKPK